MVSVVWGMWYWVEGNLANIYGELCPPTPQSYDFSRSDTDLPQDFSASAFPHCFLSGVAWDTHCNRRPSYACSLTYAIVLNLHRQETVRRCMSHLLLLHVVFFSEYFWFRSVGRQPRTAKPSARICISRVKKGFLRP